ncbi:uncharacterized protein SAPINGB_P004100 [Magnusiomyces paraingens]|uniref:Inhibitor I9 domain-containing protein n=1 Tax=Magnusiomyces paraingens TaxID=2606893 RepID=A0A5E8BY68_9ASCO|nr:uncharacterized protein SAPINGB_P004100 [Saprochaete ingens]VVT54487.1 unnamed protein product [Saprochaete ingens]
MRLFATIFTLFALIVAVVFADDSISSRYIIVFEKGFKTPSKVVSTVESKLKDLGFSIVYRYNTVLNGFAVTPTNLATFADTYKTQEDVLAKFAEINDADYPFFVEKDQEAKINQ